MSEKEMKKILKNISEELKLLLSLGSDASIISKEISESWFHRELAHKFMSNNKVPEKLSWEYCDQNTNTFLKFIQPNWLISVIFLCSFELIIDWLCEVCEFKPRNEIVSSCPHCGGSIKYNKVTLTKKSEKIIEYLETIESLNLKFTILEKKI